MVERMNRTLLGYLTRFVSQNQRDWDTWIPLFLLSYRSAIHETTGRTPAMMMLAHDLCLPLDLERGPVPFAEPFRTDLASALQDRLDKIHNFARDRIILTSDKMKARYDA